MSTTSESQQSKPDQILSRFYIKLSLLVNNARSTTEQVSSAKVDRWFNLETPETDLFKDFFRSLRNRHISIAPPKFELQVLLNIPDLNNNQVLVHIAPDSSRIRVDPTPKHILLETWHIVFQQCAPEESSDIAPSTIYKNGIPLFRSVYALLRILPTWKLFRRLRRRMGGGPGTGGFAIHLRLSEEAPDSSLLRFDTPLSASSPPLSTQTHEFPPIQHPMGSILVSTTHLIEPNFRLDDLESLLSSRFLSLDEGPDFTPTLTKNQQRDSMSTSPPGSSPLRKSIPLSRSPPSALSAAAERFVLPPPSASKKEFPSRGTSVSPPNRGIIAPPLHGRTISAGFDSGVASAISDGSSSRRSIGSAREEIVSRLRKESNTSVTGRDLPSTGSSPGSPLSIRRPNINPVHPFKSSTLSSAAGASGSLHSPSPSLRQSSPLSGPSLPSRPQPQIQTQSPASTRSPITPLPPSPNRVPPSPVVGPGFRNSPPVVPSNLGGGAGGSERNSLDGPPSAGGKRYSSSFPHRIGNAGTAPASEGSPGSGSERREALDRPMSASYLSTNTDDDDISAFVQDIDARKPLRVGGLDGGLPSRMPLGENKTAVDADDQMNASSSREPMLTSASAVDERLREMNEKFNASLAEFTNTPNRVRPRYGSNGSGFSIASEEVIGKLELEDNHKRRGEGL